jgi:hypothetical protein
MTPDAVKEIKAALWKALIDFEASQTPIGSILVAPGDLRVLLSDHDGLEEAVGLLTDDQARERRSEPAQ